MGLLSKMRSRDVDDRKSDLPDDDADGDAAPPPYEYYTNNGQPAYYASDDKASLAGTDEKDEMVDDSLEDVDPQAVWLDARKASKGGTSIVRRTTQEILYTMHMDKRWTRGNVLIFEGAVAPKIDLASVSSTSASASTSAAASTSVSTPAASTSASASTSSSSYVQPLPYATIKMGSVYLRESSDPQVEAIKYKNKQFLRPPKWYSPPNTFTHQGTDYRLKQIMNSWTGKYTLILADDPAKKPLCLFRPAKKIFGELRGSIEILPIAISTNASPNPHALLQDDQPTRLLDLALVAERMLRRYNEQIAIATAAANAS